jgi:signal peptidase II
MTVIPHTAVARSRGVRWAMVGITVAVLAADQVTKSLVVVGRIPDGSSFGWVSVFVIRNHGATAGIASGYPVLVTLAVLALTTLTAALAVRVSSPGAALCLAVVLGGALGNLSDRIFRSPGFGRGGVVDWIHPIWGGGSFDLADLALLLGVLGTIAAMAVAWRARKRRVREERASMPSSANVPVRRAASSLSRTAAGASA